MAGIYRLWLCKAWYGLSASWHGTTVRAALFWQPRLTWLRSVQWRSWPWSCQEEVWCACSGLNNILAAVVSFTGDCESDLAASVDPRPAG